MTEQQHDPEPAEDRTDAPPPASGTGMAVPTVRSPRPDEDEVQDPPADAADDACDDEDRG